MDRQDTKAHKQHSWNAACGGARRMRAEQSGHPELSQGPSDFCTVYSQMLYQLSYSRNGLCPQATSTFLQSFAAQESNIEKMGGGMI